MQYLNEKNLRLKIEEYHVKNGKFYVKTKFSCKNRKFDMNMKKFYITRSKFTDKHFEKSTKTKNSTYWSNPKGCRSTSNSTHFKPQSKKKQIHMHFKSRKLPQTLPLFSFPKMHNNFETLRWITLSCFLFKSRVTVHKNESNTDEKTFW
jgi:hypothetical protein